MGRDAGANPPPDGPATIDQIVAGRYLVATRVIERRFVREWLVVEQASGRAGWLWCVRRSLLPMAVDRARFLAAAKALLGVRAPGALPVLECGVRGLDAWLLVPHVPGLRLDDVLTARRTTPERRANLAVALIGAVRELRRVGLAHGYLTPDDVLVGPEDQVLLAGVGLWRELEPCALMSLLEEDATYLSARAAAGVGGSGRDDLHGLVALVARCLAEPRQSLDAAAAALVPTRPRVAAAMRAVLRGPDPDAALDELAAQVAPPRPPRQLARGTKDLPVVRPTAPTRMATAPGLGPALAPAHPQPHAPEERFDTLDEDADTVPYTRVDAVTRLPLAPVRRSMVSRPPPPAPRRKR